MMSTHESLHVPVLLNTSEGESVLEYLKPKPGDRVLDATEGLGGHSEAFLRAIGPTGKLVGIDADEENLLKAKERLKGWKQQCTFVHDNFRHVSRLNFSEFDIIFADLGMSSLHVDDAQRGFSFRADAPLDLRFDRSKGMTASQLLHAASEEELVRIFKVYGELPQARRCASAIFREARQHSVSLDTTVGLRQLVEKLFGFRAKFLLPQIFQALRIAVNDEMGALEEFLASIPALIAPNGSIGIISFHSLEDRRVKEAFRAWTTPEKDPRTGAIAKQSPFELLTRKVVVPSEEEIRRNPRARSARFRAVRRREITA